MPCVAKFFVTASILLPSRINLNINLHNKVLSILSILQEAHSFILVAEFNHLSFKKVTDSCKTALLWLSCIVLLVSWNRRNFIGFDAFSSTKLRQLYILYSVP